MSALDRAVGQLTGVGPKRAAALARLGLVTLGDFLTFFPRDYEDRTQLRPILLAKDAEKVCIRATVAAQPTVANIRKGMSLTKVRVFDETGAMNLTFFNNPYVKSQLQPGEDYVFFGAVEARGGYKSMASPAFERVGAGQVTGRILPVYPLTQGITRRVIMDGVAAALKAARDGWQEVLPRELLARYKLCPVDFAYEKIHNPESFEDVRQARRRLIFEELFIFSCASRRLKGANASIPGKKLTMQPMGDFFALLPYTPTGAQVTSTREIFADMTSGRRMNRLLQGDVGSGKTMVAAAAAWLAAKNGMQAAIMAPTELLASQHYDTMSRIFSGSLRCGLLTSSLNAAQKREVKARVAAGEIDILCGTHALIQSDVVFQNAGLFVVDEQHRFGVRQRATLSEKSGDAHLLVMSATPIPRTLTLIIFGDLDVSVLDELPPGRQEILTYAIGEDKRERMLGFVRRQIDEGGQVYIVCPIIEDQEGASEKTAATAYAADLQGKLPQARIGLMHGRLKGAEKDGVMAAFAARELDILVSTTVIEVGVNVPNATLMIVENADSFGLSQLHQLRGRVGRGNRQSYCILMQGDPGETAKARLAMLCKTTDGFLIAEEDLRLRGPGDFFGTKQHGLPEFRIANLAGDTRVLQAAMDAANEILEADPALEGHPLLRQRVEESVANAQKSALN